MENLSIEIEDINTWAKEFVKIATQNKSCIIAYHKFKKDIAVRSNKDVLLRYNTPLNPYEAKYQKIVHCLDELLKPCNIVGYHCTKLTDYEIENIKRNGMNILSRELVQKRLISAYKQAYLLKHEFDYLTTSPKINAILHNKHGIRTGQIYFSPNRST